MTSTEANEFFAQRTEEVVGGDQQDYTKHRSSFEAKQSIAQAPKKSRGAVRLVVHHHFEFTNDELKALEEAHGRKYVDAVDYGRALLAWVQAEGRHEEQYLPDAIEYADRFTVEVAK